MTRAVIAEAGRLRVLRDGVTRLDTDQPMLHAVFLSGQISLPQRQAAMTYVAETIIRQTDSYSLGSVPTGSNVVLGMMKWQTPGNAERLVNDGKWMSYAGEMIQLCWASTYGATAQGLHPTHYTQLTSLGRFFVEVVGGTAWLRDHLFIRAPYTVSIADPQYRTRPASTLDYRLYVGQFA